ncbi:hypothetical protein H4P12_17680 [Paracoccus sp. 11-3]|uniref:Uncharacterized protein n=1 Tax=Paracoccus amoyensis TaxID=2760093 RepID=A0A926GRD5_9RHOB|nr:hypothetical protein [Paracoccus amoyensis]MBC9248495.1 hypothetical protein [Paracoccus amoyensis]
MSQDLIINITSQQDMSSWDVGKKILEKIFSVPKLIPEKIATFGEVTARNGFSISDIGQCEPYWAAKATMRISGAPVDILQDFSWKRSKVAKSKATVTFPTKNMKQDQILGGIFFQSEFRKDINWLDIFTTWCDASSAFAGMLHPFSGDDIKTTKRSNLLEMSLDEEIAEKARARFRNGIFHTEFRAGDLNSKVSGLTDLGWANWFGGYLAKEVNADAISAAGFIIKKFGNSYMIQLTDNIDDAANDHELLSHRRAKLKGLFKKNLFLI